MKTICICGGGGLGHTVSGYLAAKGYLVNILSNHAKQWHHTITIYDCKGKSIQGHLNTISEKPEDVIPQSDIVLLTLPGYMIAETLKAIKPHVKPNTYIGSIFSSSGFFFIAQDIFPEGANLFGFQRVPFISRVKEYGSSAYLSGYRDILHLATYGFEANGFEKEIEKMFDIPTDLLDNYLEAALTNSNPILHPSRLYSLFKDYQRGMSYPQELYFYETWDEESSEILIACDNEFQTILNCFNIHKIPTLLEHYESHDIESITKKISSLKPLHGIKAPMIHTNNGYVPDFSNRYFLEDIPYGMLILKILAEHLQVSTPTMDKILFWAQQFMGEEYVYKEGNKINVKKYIFDPFVLCKLTGKI